MIKHDWRYNLAHFPDALFLAFGKLLKLILFSFNNILRKWQSFLDVWNNSDVWRLARYLTFPLHWIWILAYKESKKKKYDSNLFDIPGLQIISGNTGAGKTSLVYEIIERYRILFGKPWYINSDFEKPRYNEPLQAYIRYHRYMEFGNVWNDFETKIQLNKNLYGGYVLDEFTRIFDHRQNQTTEYLSKFVPFRDYTVLIRKNIERIIGITQLDRLDIHLMYLVKMWHKPRIDIGFDYEDWMLKSGLFRFKIKGWYIDSYTINTSDQSNMLVPFKSWYLKAEYADFEYYDTYAYSDAYNHVPLDMPNMKYNQGGLRNAN